LSRAVINTGEAAHLADSQRRDRGNTEPLRDSTE